MVLSLQGLAFLGPVPPGGLPGSDPRRGRGPARRRPDPSWFDALARLIARMLAAAATGLMVMAARLAFRRIISHRQWLSLVRFGHKLQRAAFAILCRLG